MTKTFSKVFSLALILALVLGVLPIASRPAQALSSDIVISQVYGGGGNNGGVYTNDFVELFNRGTTTVSLAGWSIQYTSATGTGLFGSATNLITPLSGSLAPGQYLLVQEAAGSNVIAALPTPDITDSSPINMSGTGGKVALVTSTSGLGCNGGSTPCTPAQLVLIKDLVGWDGANFYETAPAPATTNSTAVLRLGNGCTETDYNAMDFAAGTPTPRNTASPFNPCAGGDAAPTVDSTYPMNGATDFPVGANLSVTFSEPVDVTPSWFTLVCSVSGPSGVPTSFSGGPTTFTLDPGVTLTNGESCTLTVLANQVSDQDSNDPPDNMVMNFTVGFSPYNVCDTAFTPIYAIQGSGLSAAITGNITTQGVVVGDFEGSAGLSGFYLQDMNGDGDTATSDGIFVYTGSANLVNAGQVVRVTGYARERYNQTAINGSNSNSSAVSAANVVQCGTASVAPAVVSLPVASQTDFEPFEGMLVTFPQELVISEYFNFDRYGEIVLTTNRQYTPTAVVEPGPDAVALAAEYALNRITLDDGRSVPNPDPAIHPNGNIFDLDNLFRGGDIVQNVTGVMGYDFSLWRIQPTQGADYTSVNPRTAQPDDVGGNIKVASANVLNYFTTLNDRGANTDEELARQRAKIVAELVAIDADVVGLMEIENNTAAIADLVAGLNDAMGAGTYALVDTGVIGTDAIKVAFIYKPTSVSLVGDFAILDSSVDARFIDTKNRPALAQTYMDNETGGVFTVVVNHLKSKGSDCNDVGDPDLLDGAGNCNLTRKAAAEALVDWLATDPTGSGDNDYLIIGDLNSYDKEDPIDAILAGADDTLGTADDYTDMNYAFQGEYAYSYVFDGQVGYLDHALASAGLVDEITGVTEWHVNADEPDLIDYDMTYKADAQDALYEPNAYRASDHDPIIIGLNVCDEIAPKFDDISVTPNVLWPANHKYVDVTATVSVSDNFDPNPTVELVSVTSNEPDDGEDDGNTVNDIVIVDDFNFKLRAERSGIGTGRIYAITYLVTDACGNSATATVTVTVPLSQGK